MSGRNAGLIMPSLSRALSCCVLALLALSGCAVSPTITTDAAPDADFAGFQTFSFLPSLSTDRAGYHTLVSQQLMFSTRRELEVRGIEFVADPAEADILVNFHVDVVQELRVRQVQDPFVGPSYWNHRRGRYSPWRAHSNWPGPATRTQVDQISRGRLNVDIIDQRLNMLLWEGVASKRLTQRTMNDLGPAMDAAVHEMFLGFPVEPIL